MNRVPTVIMGAAGRDFHNFNVVYRDDPGTEVIAFTAAQIPGIDNRRYPGSLAGSLYPDGISIVAEEELERLCRAQKAARVVFAYSDVRHIDVMHKASRALAAGADFVLLGPGRTMIDVTRPVIAVSAVRTGCGKSGLTRWLALRLRQRRMRVAVIRHPMPYGDLERQAVQRFASAADLSEGQCTLEEREEYEPHIALGSVVFAGVDYQRITTAAEREADIILWDGGNNDFPFIRPNLHIVLVDPLRAGDETTYHPGEAVLRMADIVVVAKTDAATPAAVAAVTAAAHASNPRAAIVRGRSPVTIDFPERVRGRRVLVIEDGPTLTHGGMAFGAGYVAAKSADAATIVDPRPFAPAEFRGIYDQYPHIGHVLPAIGYDGAQCQALAKTIEAAAVDVVVVATPIDLAALLPIKKPVVRVRYEFAEADAPRLSGLLDEFLRHLPQAREIDATGHR